MSRRTGFLAVAGRELRWIWGDRAAFLLVFIIPLLAASFLAGTTAATLGQAPGSAAAGGSR